MLVIAISSISLFLEFCCGNKKQILFFSHIKIGSIRKYYVFEFKNVALAQRFDYKSIKQELHFEYSFY